MSSVVRRAAYIHSGMLCKEEKTECHLLLLFGLFFQTSGQRFMEKNFRSLLKFISATWRRLKEEDSIVILILLSTIQTER